MSFDAWLEKPYQRQAEDDAAFERFCDTHDFAYDDPRAPGAFSDWWEAAAEAAAERRWYADLEAAQHAEDRHAEERGEW